MKPLQILRSVFGYQKFREGQIEIIQNCLEGRDVFAILPTGGGKSLCFQVPGLCLGGKTIVISPLIALMQDQVDALVRKNIPAVYLSSTLSKQQLSENYEKIRKADSIFIYTSPERLQNKKFIKICQEAKINLIVIDEAHCISQWGDSFRPEYQQISRFLQTLADRPRIIALTASATPQVEKDIVNNLNLKPNYYRRSTGVSRPNLSLFVANCQNKQEQILYMLRILKKHQGQTGIIYASTRKSTLTCCKIIKKYLDQEIQIANYHGGMESEQRTKIQEAFLKDQIKIIVATNAFGMGIDKPDIRFVIHYQHPSSLEAYYQEVGRAGRDGKESQCYTLVEPSDQNIHLGLIAKQNRNSQIQKLKQLLDTQKFFQSSLCRMAQLQKYFGQTNPPNCKKCDNCTNYAPNHLGAMKYLFDQQEKISLLSLVEIREKLSQKLKIPSEQILTNIQLCYWAHLKPTTQEEILKIPGLGSGWYEKFSKQLSYLYN